LASHTALHWPWASHAAVPYIHNSVSPSASKSVYMCTCQYLVQDLIRSE